MSGHWRAANPFGRRTAPAVAALVILSFALMAALLVQIAWDLDRHASKQAADFAHSALDRRLRDTEREVKDYAAWGEAYQHLHMKTDIDWAFNRQNVGPTLYSELGYDFVFVVGPDGRITYNMTSGEMSQVDLRGSLRGGFDQIVARARAVGQGESKPISGFLTAAGTPVTVAAAAITPGGDQTIVQTAGSPSVLVLADLLTPARLDEIGSKAFVRGLSSGSGDAWSSEILASEDGSFPIRFTWSPEQPGRLLLIRVLPWLCAGGMAFSLLVVMIFRQTIKSAQAIEMKAQELSEAHKLLEYSACHDSMTELPNRRMLFKYLHRVLKYSPASSVALLYIDLDNFKPINDSFGHIVGDEVLRVVAGRLRMVIRDADLVARVGGDEFVVALNGTAGSTVERTCRRLLDTVPMPVPVEGQVVSVGLSVGIALAPEDATTPDDLMRMADAAMYRAKRAGGNAYRFSDLNDLPPIALAQA